MIWALALLPLLAWLGLCVGLYAYQNRLIYDRDAIAPQMGRASVYPGQVLDLSPLDDASLRTTSWYWPARGGRPTILFLHGNNGNIEVRTAWMQFALAAGWGLLMVGYRGYGGNPGRPSQSGLIHDAMQAYDYLVTEQGLDAAQIHIFGHSLGAAVAVQLAVRRPARSLGLLSPFTTMLRSAHDRYPFLPMRLIIRDQWRSIDLIGQISCPLCIVACDRDTMVRFSRSQQLYAAANSPKEFLNIPGLDHGGISLSGGPQALVDFFDRHR